MSAQFRNQFDGAATPQGGAFALGLGPVYNAFQPAYAVGNIFYASSTTELARVAPHTAATQAVFTMTGTGSAGQAPGWTVLSEAVDDRVAALIQNGTGITWTYDDTLNTLTGNVTITQYTDEMAQDAVGTILQDTSSINFTYNDGTPSIVADVIWTSPGTIGSATPNSGTFTTLAATVSAAVSVSGSEAPFTFERADAHGDGATIGNITFNGKDSGAATQTYGNVIAKATLDNAGAEEGEIELYVVTGGAVTERLSITGTGVTCQAALSVEGNTTLGNAASDTTVLNSESITRPNAPMVFAYNSAHDLNVTGNGAVHTCIFDTEVFDRSGDYDNTTGVFTAPVGGGYAIGGQVVFFGATVDVSIMAVNVVASNRTTQVGNVQGINSGTMTAAMSAGNIDLDAGDTLSIQVTITGMAGNNADFLGAANPVSHLSIHLVG